MHLKNTIITVLTTQVMGIMSDKNLKHSCLGASNHAS